MESGFKFDVVGEGFGFGSIVGAVGEGDWADVVQVLIEQVEIVLLKVLQVVLRLHSSKESPKTMLGE